MIWRQVVRFYFRNIIYNDQNQSPNCKKNHCIISLFTKFSKQLINILEMTKLIMNKDVAIIQEFFNKINQFELPSTWDSHRNELKKIIGISEFFGENFDNSVIIGAGNLYDLPFNEIVENYEQTDLLDVDSATLIKAKDRVDTELQSKVNLITRDIVGYPEQISILDLQDLDKNSVAVKELLQQLFSAELCPIKIFQTQYSLAISSTVSSQLILPISKITDHSSNDEVIVMTKELGDIIADRHVKQVWDLLKRGGIGIISSEQYAWGSIDNSPLPLTKVINDPALMMDENIQSQIELIKGGLVINGRVTSESILHHIPQSNILKESEWIWQFDNELFYLVKCWVIIKDR